MAAVTFRETNSDYLYLVFIHIFKKSISTLNHGGLNKRKHSRFKMKKGISNPTDIEWLPDAIDIVIQNGNDWMVNHSGGLQKRCPEANRCLLSACPAHPLCWGHMHSWKDKIENRCSSSKSWVTGNGTRTVCVRRKADLLGSLKGLDLCFNAFLLISFLSETQELEVYLSFANRLIMLKSYDRSLTWSQWQFYPEIDRLGWIIWPCAFDL